MKLPTHKQPIQNAWVVDDIDTAAMHWVENMGVGPFFIAEYNSTILTDTSYRGKPTEITMITALAYAGDCQIELVQPIGKQSNIYRDTVPVGSTGFHHICCWSDDLKADIQHYQSFPDVVLALNTGKVDAILYDAEPLRGAHHDVSPHLTGWLQDGQRQEVSDDDRLRVVFISAGRVHTMIVVV